MSKILVLLSQLLVREYFLSILDPLVDTQKVRLKILITRDSEIGSHSGSKIGSHSGFFCLTLDL